MMRELLFWLVFGPGLAVALTALAVAVVAVLVLGVAWAVSIIRQRAGLKTQAEVDADRFFREVPVR